MKRALVLLLLVCMLTGTVPPVMRLHILARSDEPQDQAVKLLVRDAIVAHLEREMVDLADFHAAKAYIEANLDTLQTIADDILSQNGMPYRSRASVGLSEFPQREYGGVVFERGTYHALRIELGQGDGQNWWCVLFPPLCLLETQQVDEQWEAQDGVTYVSWFAQLFSK